MKKIISDFDGLRFSETTLQYAIDAAERLIEMVLEKDEKVVIVENSLLQKYEQVGLITRY